MRKSINVTLFFSVLMILCMPVISLADDAFFVPEYTSEYKEWQTLSEEEKQQVIEPQIYENPEDVAQADIQTFSADNNMVGSGLPTKFTRNDYGKVRNQTTNLCWACSATTAFENNYRLTNYRIKEFSDLHMEYMTSNTYNNQGFNRAYNTGGNINIALAYATNGMGIVADSGITASNFKNAQPIAKVSDYEIISSYRVKDYIYQYGAISAYTCMATNYFSSSNLWNNADLAYYCSNSSAKANHAITIVGWDDNYTNPAFPGQRGAYVVLNSYGTSFGKNGLYYIFYNDVFVRNASFFAVTKTENCNYKNLYQYDEYGQTATIGWSILSGGTYAANVFTKKTSQAEDLTELGIYFPTTENVTIYVNANGNDKNKNHATYVFSSDTENPGYHTVKLPKPVTLTNNQFTVIVQYHGYMGAELASTDANSWWYTISSNYGESYISRDGQNWRDLKTATELGGRCANACIKAFTTASSHANPSMEIEAYRNLANYVFDYRYYAEHNLDLYQAFGYNQTALKNHWETYGKAEGRAASCIFDGKYYVANNGDLQVAFGNNYTAAYQHFMVYGYREYRKSSLEYDGNYYKKNNGDLGNMSSVELIRHYSLYGKSELRQASNNYDIVQYLFDSEVYAKMNPDLTAAFGYNEIRLKDHWLRYGIAEGRIASLVFDNKYYLTLNTDVKNVFGNNYIASYNHFVQYGFQEKRQASSVFSISYYQENNTDVKNTYGTNCLRALNHFALVGKNEKRATANNFNVEAYQQKNGDLYHAYRNQYQMYYIHYMQYGRHENRVCR